MQTFLFTDIEGSTRLWERHPQAMQAALARHDALLRGVIAAHGGMVFKTVGDAFHAIFPGVVAAVAAAVAAQRALGAERWPEIGTLRVRMALHAGPAEHRDGDYFGPTLNRLARLLAAGHGGQILLSASARELLRAEQPEVELRDLGERQLKDLSSPERICQVLAPDLPAQFPPLRTLDARPTNLPAQATRLIGRQQEVASITALLRRPAVRLVTLTGPGGTGKTRLSLQVAAELLDEFEDGVFFVGLAAIKDPALIASAIAQALALKEAAGTPLARQLEEFLAARQLLLVLDNLEQLLAGAPLVADLLSASPLLKLLATSQAPLQVRGEHEVPILPLALPAAGRPAALDDLADVPAIQLFVERASGSRPDFMLTSENAPAVAEICRRLDGLPLAIELAAARTKVLTPQAMLPRLERRLKLLTSGAHDLPARHQTLRGAIDWSYDLLAAEERRLFELLGVFVGGCSLEAIAALNGGDDALDVVESLVAKSLLRQSEGLNGEPRFFMLETIHEYALERLEARGALEPTRDAHLEFYRAALRQMPLRAPSAGGDQFHVFRWMGLEHDNLRATLDWAFARDRVDLAGEIAGGMTFFWDTHCHFAEGIRTVERVIERAGALPLAEQAALYQRAGYLAVRATRYDKAEQYLDKASALHRQTDNQSGLASTLIHLGTLALVQNDSERAEQLYEEALAIREAQGDSHGSGGIYNNLGEVARMRGDYKRAEELYQTFLAAATQEHNLWYIALSYHNLGYMALYRGDLAQARQLFRQSLEIHHGQGNKRGIAECLAGLAAVDSAAGGGRDRRAALLVGAAAALLDGIQSRIDGADGIEFQRTVEALRDRMGEAAYGEAWQTGRILSEQEAIAAALEAGESVSGS